MALDTLVAPPVPEIPRQRMPSTHELGGTAYRGARLEKNAYVGKHRAEDSAVPTEPLTTHAPNERTLPLLNTESVTSLLPLYTPEQAARRHADALRRTSAILDLRLNAQDELAMRDWAAFQHTTRAPRPPLSAEKRDRLVAAHTGDFGKAQ